MHFAIYDTSKTDSSNHNGFQVTGCVYTNNIVEFYQNAAQSGIATCMVEYIEDGSLRGPGSCEVGSYFLPSEEKITNKPLIASHSSPRNFTPDFERNMSDNMIKSLAENNGIIMINFGSSFINKKSNILYAEIQESVESWRLNKGYEINDIEVAKKREELIKNKNPFADLEDVLIAIDHVKNLVGDDFIGFGSDFDGLGDSLPNNLKNVSYYPMILEGLLNRGYSKESIEKICYKNLFRVWDTNLQNHQT